MGYAKQTVNVTKTTVKTRSPKTKSTSKSSGSNQNRYPVCGKYMSHK